MKVRQREPEDRTRVQPRQNMVWKVLIVDDEPGVRQVTRMNLRNFIFMGRKLEFIEAGSAKEARDQLALHPDIAVALLDVVMETDDAGLRLIDHIRNHLNNSSMRLIIRTGQPGLAPERMIIDKYDINDFKDKAETTSQKLYTTVRLSIKEYHYILSVEANKNALRHILKVTPFLYELKVTHLEEYFQWILSQVVTVYSVAHTGMISLMEGMLITLDDQEIALQATVGEFELNAFGPERRKEIIEICKAVVLEDQAPTGLRSGSIVIPLQTKKHVFGFVYLECSDEFEKSDFELLKIFANQCAAGLENIRLHHNLELSYDHAVDMLAVVSEFKDKTVGGHIRRIQLLTKRLALALGISQSDTESYSKASRLHDVGKVGIPDSVLCKPSALTDSEFKLISTHTTIGDQILSNTPELDVARVVARSHHEKWDGRGYPDGLYGNEIPLPARIVAVVDVFDALASPRPYKNAWSMSDIIKEMQAGSGSHFDPIVVSTFLRMLRNGELDDLVAEYGQYKEFSV
jgi:response regulator RpfG family c-di-GMP phosphodiesterase